MQETTAFKNVSNIKFLIIKNLENVKFDIL
jgi:hypothetical protein